MDKGLVYLFTGKGKGKTSAALGVALRMLLLNKKVVWVAWYKSKSWPISEIKLENRFPKLLKMYWVGKGFFIKGDNKKVRVNSAWVEDREIKSEHEKAAEVGLIQVGKVLMSQNTDLIILDEVIQAIGDGLVEEKAILELIKNRGKSHLILTGRGASRKLIDAADLVTEMKKIKHPYDTGGLAIKGLDY